MGDRIQELQEDLKSDDEDSVESAAIEVVNIGIGDPERIAPVIEELQEVVREGEGKSRRKAVYALAKYGEEVDRGALEAVEDCVFELLEGSQFDQQNGLIAATALDSSKFADMAEELTDGDDTTATSAATLAYLRLIRADLEWLPISQKHVQCVVGAGNAMLRDKYPEYLFYLLDTCCSHSGQGHSALHNIMRIQKPSAEFAMTVTRFVNEYPEERLDSDQIGALSEVAKKQPQAVVENLELSADDLRGGGRMRRQYMWTLANAAEADPNIIDDEFIEVSRELVEDGGSCAQDIRLLGAVRDTESRSLLEEDMNDVNHKIQSAKEKALERIRSASELSDDDSATDDSSSVGQSEDTDRGASSVVSDSGNSGSGSIVDAPSGSAVSEEADGLADLWERASEAAREDPVREQVTSTSSRYHRSTPIKEYARARADGVCECCGEPAPFTDVDGEPYLEVHHVDELGEGGADSPDRVVAVCPTCHRRIHYGADGDVLNERLEDKLASGLGSVGSQSG